LGEKRHRQLSQVAPGVFHHLDEFDVQIFDHGPVDRADLLGGQRRDRAAAHSTHRPSFRCSARWWLRPESPAWRPWITVRR
jgi:hypothetical protein